MRQKGLINFEDDEMENKMHYEFKSTENNIGKIHPNVHDQPDFPSFDSDDSELSIEYIKAEKINNMLQNSDSSDSDDSNDKKTYTLDDL